MELKTKRLELKPLSAADKDALVELLTDDVVKQTYMVPDFPTRAAVENLAEKLRLLSGQKGRYVVGIFLGQTLIGILNETEVSDSRIELGYALLPQYHNCGYGTEALSGTIGWLFDHSFEEVVAAAFEDNEASIRVMKKSGMTRLGRQEEVAYRGKLHCCVYCSVRRPGLRSFN